MKLIEVKSSNVMRVGHENGALFVEYRGGTYSYVGVSEKTFGDLLKAESKGKFMNSEIKGKYPYKKII